MACAMVEDVVRVVAASSQRTSIHCIRLHPFVQFIQWPFVDMVMVYLPYKLQDLC
jgi:hypothetical protein